MFEHVVTFLNVYFVIGVVFWLPYNCLSWKIDIVNSSFKELQDMRRENVGWPTIAAAVPTFFLVEVMFWPLRVHGLIFVLRLNLKRKLLLRKMVKNLQKMSKEFADE